MIAFAQGVGADLGRRVRGLAPKGVCLVDRDEPRRAVDLRRRGQHDPLQFSAGAAGVEDVRRPQHVGLHHIERVLIRVGDRDQRPQVEDPGAVLDRLADRLGILQVAPVDLDLALDLGREPVELAAVVAAVVSDQRGPDGRLGPDAPPGDCR